MTAKKTKGRTLKKNPFDRWMKQDRLQNARISHRLTDKAHDRPAITSLRLLAVLTVLSSTRL